MYVYIHIYKIEKKHSKTKIFWVRNISLSPSLFLFIPLSFSLSFSLKDIQVLRYHKMTKI